MIINATMEASKKGPTERLISLSDNPAIGQATNKFTPTGGVICPIATFTVRMIPK